MIVHCVFLPAHLGERDLSHSVVIVLDVLRATTSIAAALDAGVESIAVYPSIETARQAHVHAPNALLCGEQKSLPPPGFDLGNSPRAFTPERCKGRGMILSTTNGTRAILAARSAGSLFCGAIVNATAVARAAVAAGRSEVVLLCSGTDGELSLEDTVGAGAIIDGILSQLPSARLTDGAAIAHRLFLASRQSLRDTLASSQGGRNVVAAGLEPDIDFAARLDALDIVGQITAQPGMPPVILPHRA